MNLDGLRERSELLKKLPDAAYEEVASLATVASFDPGAILFDEDEEAATFFILSDGIVALELISPSREPITIQTLGVGELVGISWLFPPYRWNWRASAVGHVAAAAFDAAAVRQRCADDPELKMWVLRVVAEETARRLHNTRVQLLDLYKRV